jgi:hypothetical protein
VIATVNPPARVALGGLLAAVALACVGCTTTYERAPRPATDLSGHWVLDPAASDDAAKLIEAAVPKYRRRPDWEQPPQLVQQSTGQGGRNGGQTQIVQVTVRPPSWARLGARDFLTAFALPAARLDLTQAPASIVLDQAGRRRTFEPGDDTPRSVTDRYGSRTVLSGWKGAEFIVSSQDGSRLAVEERFRLLAPDRLATVVSFHAERLKGVTIRSVYRRATDAELSASPPEGPPAPGPR